MHVVVIGSGRMGVNIAKALANDEHDVVVVDKEEKNLENLGTVFNGQRIKGIEIDKDVLIGAGINKADVFLAMTPDDNVNIMSAQIAKDIFDVKRVIARVCEPEKEYIYKQLGIEYISSIKLSVEVIKNKICSYDSMDLVTLDDEMCIVEIPVLCNNFLKVEDIENKYECRVSALYKNGQFGLAKAKDLVNKGDKLICTILRKNKNSLVMDLVKERLL